MNLDISPFDVLIYLGIGLIVTLAMIFYYRPDGRSQKPGELYMATVGPLIWPILLAKFIFDELL